MSMLSVQMWSVQMWPEHIQNVTLSLSHIDHAPVNTKKIKFTPMFDGFAFGLLFLEE